MKGQSPSVLVVDDDQSLRLLCRINLELDGFEVRDAGTLADARAAIGEARPDVVLLDVHLGGESSEALLDELLAEGIPVLIVTGSAEVSTLRGRAGDVLVKPFMPEDLVAAARRLVKVDAS